MGGPIEVTSNIKECVEILHNYVKNGKDKKTAENAVKYLQVTVTSAESGKFEPERGCPHPEKIEKIR